MALTFGRAYAMAPPKMRAVIFSDVFSAYLLLFKYLGERTRVWIPGNSSWPQGDSPITNWSNSSLFYHIFLSLKKTWKGIGKQKIKGAKKERKRRKEEGEGKKEKSATLAHIQGLPFYFWFQRRSSNHLALQCAELKDIWGAAKREKPWHCWQDTAQHLGCSSETCGQANLASHCWACRT